MLPFLPHYLRKSQQPSFRIICKTNFFFNYFKFLIFSDQNKMWHYADGYFFFFCNVPTFKWYVTAKLQKKKKKLHLNVSERKKVFSPFSGLGAVVVLGQSFWRAVCPHLESCSQRCTWIYGRELSSIWAPSKPSSSCHILWFLDKNLHQSLFRLG